MENEQEQQINQEKNINSLFSENKVNIKKYLIYLGIFLLVVTAVISTYFIKNNSLKNYDNTTLAISAYLARDKYINKTILIGGNKSYYKESTCPDFNLYGTESCTKEINKNISKRSQDRIMSGLISIFPDGINEIDSGGTGGMYSAGEETCNIIKYGKEQESGWSYELTMNLEGQKYKYLCSGGCCFPGFNRALTIINKLSNDYNMPIQNSYTGTAYSKFIIPSNIYLAFQKKRGIIELDSIERLRLITPLNKKCVFSTQLILTEGYKGNDYIINIDGYVAAETDDDGDGYCLPENHVQLESLLDINQDWIKKTGEKRIIISMDGKQNIYNFEYKNYLVKITPVKTSNVISVVSDKNLVKNPEILSRYFFKKNIAVVSVEDDTAKIRANVDYRKAIKKFLSNAKFVRRGPVKFAEEEFSFFKDVQQNDLRSVYLSQCFSLGKPWEYTKDRWLASSANDRIWPKGIDGLKLIISKCQSPENFIELSKQNTNSKSGDSVIEVASDELLVNRLIPDKTDLDAIKTGIPVTYSYMKRPYMKEPYTEPYTGYLSTEIKYFYENIIEEKYFINGRLNSRTGKLPDGRIIFKETYNNGFKDGKFLYWGYNGALLAEEYWENGKRKEDTQRNCWDSEGNKVDCKIYPTMGYYLDDTRTKNKRLR